MEISVLRVKKAGVNPNQAMALVDVTELEPEPFWYFIALDKEDDSEIYKAVIAKVNSGEIEIEPTDTDIAEYNSTVIREKRDKLLNETDKYMTLDYPISEENRNLIRVYRQALRDVPQQEGFPENIIWPEKPDIN